MDLPSFEFDGDTSAPPDWASWAANLGYDFFAHRSSLSSELIVISTPCQSPLGGTVALGWLLGELELPIGKRDAGSYFELLLSLPAGTRVKRVDRGGARPKEYALRLNRTDDEIEMRQVGGRGMRRNDTSLHFLRRDFSLNYVVVGTDDRESSGNDALSESGSIPFYEHISARIPVEQNWKANIDSIVIAGPTGGHSSPRGQLESVSLRLNDEQSKTISELLAVREWKQSGDLTPHYSRFFNAAKSGKDLPEIIAKSTFVIFTSPDSFQRFGHLFEQQVKLLVFSRDVGDSKLELLESALLRHMKNAPKPEGEFVNEFEQPPSGVQLMFFGRRVLQEPEF